ncbi:MAG: 3-phosphoshikimate 1-carboxyvinyltransferase [SAR324 cluster bacterium]|uniref:3-phosphoshikimate 1-carboxyvinyltransferase n=1 Tax=SAR324 cluster bacterium TaxID=2024889 RepID=A0A7X9FTJ2_9DELT|nr:3-phosphoshikimate 1-carboxyvinyltransferase [SAR324 cluster bacterium]
MRYVQPVFLEGGLEAPPSKSMMQRAVLAATFASGHTRILNPSYCDDGLSALHAAGVLGAKIIKDPSVVHIQGGHSPLAYEIDCGQSGLCLRMLCALTSIFKEQFTLTGRGSLTKRPLDMVALPLRSLGAEVELDGSFLPIKIKGPIHGGTIEVDASKSSQFLTGLLMALPLCDKDSCLRVSALKSKPYVQMTLVLLKSFGIKIDARTDLLEFNIQGRQSYCATTCNIEGDWSGAAFFLVAAAINGVLQVRNLDTQSPQADRAILDVLIQAGADMELSEEGIIVRKSNLQSFDFDASECPDLFPPLVALACYCRGISKIHGTERLKFKESDRTKALIEEFSKMGASLKEEGNVLIVKGTSLHGAEIDPHNDHRIAMATSIAAIGSSDSVGIRDSECVSKSYPGFFEELEKLASSGI